MANLPLSLPITPRPLSTKEGWADFVARSEVPQPAVPTPAKLKQMSDAERERFNGMRREHHNSFGPVLTPTLGRLHCAVYDRALSNLSGVPGARPGAVIDGYANLGKTTILIHFGREYERTLRRIYGEQMAAHSEIEWHPVVYHTLDAQTSVKSLLGGIANYYGAPVPLRATTYELGRLVVEHAQRCNTSVFLIDDIHYLDMRYTGAVEVNNALKHLANETSATFVYAGIGCSGLLREGQTQGQELFGQTRGRFAHLPVKPFDVKTDAGVAEWLALVKAFEDRLVLLQRHEGMCTNIAQYLYERTSGYVGSLSTLLRVGAAKAIENGQERITRKLLNTIKLDYAAETEYAEHLRKHGGRTR